MAVLLDTNILLRLLQPHHPHNPIVERALKILHVQNETLNITAQNIVEFWAVVTRPASENGLGFDADQAMREVDALKRLFALLPETPLLPEWEVLVSTYRVSGKNTHDARLVAAMKVHRIGSILTFNVSDFGRFSGITAVHPATV
jgi:predicted nucleic acid-binding protein